MSVTLQAGSAGIYLFVINDVTTNPERFIFILCFPIAYLASLLAVEYVLRLPRFDFLNRIAVINISVYCFLGLALSSLRLPLISREVFIMEFLVSSTLLITNYMVIHRLLPRRIGVLGDSPLDPFQRHPGLDAVRIDTSSIEDLSFDAIVTNLRQDVNPKTTHLLALLAQKRITAYDADSFIEILWGRIPLSNLTSIEIESFIPPALYVGVKRVIEIALILALLPLLVVLSLAISFAIKLDSPGPIIFRQQRTGFQGEAFTMLKFRSMVKQQDQINRFAEKEDNRVTRVGKLIRRLRLDEVPQLWNVICGEMSLIGPRPEQIQFTERFEKLIPFYGFRHMIRPGVTGWSQVMYGYAASDDQTRAKLEFDFYYIKHMSAWLDILVLVKTLRTIILGSGVR
jgi:lipopolysaccharide/colanic/teichoic acid biosynthesis glycosyltransferase